MVMTMVMVMVVVLCDDVVVMGIIAMMVPSLQGEDLWAFWDQVGSMVMTMVMVRRKTRIMIILNFKLNRMSMVNLTMILWVMVMTIIMIRITMVLTYLFSAVPLTLDV